MTDLTPPDDSFGPLLALLTVHLSNGQPFSEYELMSWLKAPEQGIFAADALADPLTLFRSHFILMHCLHRLRRQWAETREAALEISALRIQRLPWRASAEQLPGSVDAVAEYYLNIEGLKTGREEVDALLSSFWRRMLVNDHSDEDLSVLGLTAPASDEDIRLQYRRLAMRHHPDRGGDELTFCRIQTAYQRLKNRFL
ncbi:DNA-J related domain-containing protein [Thalassolituus sp. LLYu03]|uniref:DNA-J related domain-containing protein n=1 Tax=Thalassolituus sp. LLYu03 TaxID=3421656 RepID=UPI003D2C2295